MKVLGENHQQRGWPTCEGQSPRGVPHWQRVARKRCPLVTFALTVPVYYYIKYIKKKIRRLFQEIQLVWSWSKEEQVSPHRTVASAEQHAAGKYMLSDLLCYLSCLLCYLSCLFIYLLSQQMANHNSTVHQKIVLEIELLHKILRVCVCVCSSWGIWFVDVNVEILLTTTHRVIVKYKYFLKSGCNKYSWTADSVVRTFLSFVLTCSH